MLTYAIEFVQDVQLFCLAIVFFAMALRDRRNLSLRWMALSYAVVIVEGVANLFASHLPAWILHGIVIEVALVGYGCFHIAMIRFFNRGYRTRWVPLILVLGSLPFHILFSSSPSPMANVMILDITLGIQTAVTACLLVRCHGTMDAIRIPCLLMTVFLGIYSAVEWVRVGVAVATHQLAGDASPHLEIVSGLVYVVAASILPLVYIWMMNARLHSELQRQTVVDPLTNVLNRRGLEKAGEQALALAARTRFDLALVAIDIDHFKKLNDTHGHDGGDVVLTETGRVLTEMLRLTDSIGRIGGEEFVAVLVGTNRLGARDVVERLRARLEWHQFVVDGKPVHITASFGISFYDGRAMITWRELMREADAALYEAKRLGRNRAVVFEEEKVF